MPDIEFTCPGCGQTLEAPVEMAGETVECPSCHQSMVVPAAPDAESDTDDMPLDDTETPPVSAADIVAGLARQAAAPETATCSECGHDMEPGAVLCLQCGYHTGLGRKISTELG